MAGTIATDRGRDEPEPDFCNARASERRAE